MSKSLSGLFSGTEGYALETFARETGIRPIRSTAEVWNHITATDRNYIGTPIPKSFVLDTPNGNFWAHPNGTKHMEEALNSIKEYPMLKNTNPSLYAQFILYDFREAVIAATANGAPKPKTKCTVGNWEFFFDKRASDKYPVIYHAKFLGLN